MSQNTRVEQTHDGSGQLDERNSSSAHIVKGQFALEENRDIPLFNTDNEFNRAINEEDIDFNIPGLPHSAVKQEHGASVHNLIQKIENHFQGQALQIDFQQRHQFNLFIKESKQMIHEVGNVELCELPEGTVQRISVHAGTWTASIAHANTSCATERRRTENLSSTPWISSRFRITV